MGLFDIAAGIAAVVLPNKAGRSLLTEPTNLITAALGGNLNVAELPQYGIRFGNDIMSGVLGLDPTGKLDIAGNAQVSKVIVGAALAKKAINAVHKNGYSVKIPVLNKQVDLL
jgi:hypothetical protein